MTAVADWQPPSASWRAFSIGLVCLLALFFSLATINSLYINKVIGAQMSRIAVPFPAEESRPPAYTGEAAAAQNILLLGADSWNSVNGSLVDISGQRSDTIMVVHIPADRKSVYVMSVLRDSWVILPGGRPEKVNAALSYGGVPMAVQTIEGLISARIDHVALVDYAGFSGLTDAIGGVEIDNPTAFESSAADHFYPAGLQHLTGTEVLAFAREWGALPDGDFQRARNQQLVMKSVLVKAMQRDTLTDPLKVAVLLGAVTPYVAVDDGLNLNYLTTLAASLRNIREPNFVFFTAPTKGIGTSPDGQSIVNLDWTKLADVQQAFKTDALQTYQPEPQTMHPVQ
jgi:LCP family protein required for cell wall assembly